MKIEIVLANGSACIHVLEIKSGTTVMDAVRYSGLVGMDNVEKIDGYGIFGRIVEPTRILKEGDRVEIYCPLRLTPQERRLLVIRKKKQKQSGSS